MGPACFMSGNGIYEINTYTLFGVVLEDDTRHASTTSTFTYVPVLDGIFLSCTPIYRHASPSGQLPTTSPRSNVLKGLHSPSSP
ncbi:hypothetical protein BDZ91DRAFT_752972 [Kalaharituber pfeilii]|nr:hypothetical protein BDZ91DRAFT_752972 [Kalaharituber pfeilii]